MTRKLNLGLIFGLGLMLTAGFAAFVTSGDKASAAKGATAAAAPAPRIFSDWRLQCGGASGADKTNCTMFQGSGLGKEGDKNQPIGLATIVHITQVKDKPTPVIRLVTPLGAALTSGILFKIDDGKQTQVPYMKCLPGGCLTELIFDKDLLDKLRGGKILAISYQFEGKNRIFKVSLKGFPQALDALETAEKHSTKD